MTATKAKFNEQANLKLVRLYTTSREHEAIQLCQRLCDEGLSAQVVGQHIDSGQPLPSSIEIWIPQKQLKPASKLLEGWDVIGKQSANLDPFPISHAITFLMLAVGMIAMFALIDSPIALAFLFVGCVIAIASIKSSSWFRMIGTSGQLSGFENRS